MMLYTTQEPSYSADVNESAPVGSVVAAVHATDPDSGDNGRVTYRLAAETGGAAEFDVNATTGEVITKPFDNKCRHSKCCHLAVGD